MNHAASWAASAFFILGVTTSSLAIAAEGSIPNNENAVTTPKQFNSMFGKRLKSVDGSKVEISTAKDALSREMTTADGALQRLNFMYLNATLGTVSDVRDTSLVIGVFRAAQQEILVHYTDGSTELLTANSRGGLSIETRSPSGTVSCRSFYDEGHVFSIDERKAALAQFARHLGITDSPDKLELQSGCHAAAEPSRPPTPALSLTPTAKNAEEAAPGLMATTPARPGVVPAIANSPSVSSLFDKDQPLAPAIPSIGTVPAVVPVSPPSEAFESTNQTANTAIAEIIPTPDGLKEGPLPPTRPVNVGSSQGQPIDKIAANGAATATASTNPEPSAEQAGASSCLVVESNGRHWGFRNRCRYDVQFAYCSMDVGNALTFCRDGSVGGSVGPNGFGILVADENLKAVNVRHDFRWVACRGGAGEVVARLDHIDPPSGRCVR